MSAETVKHPDVTVRLSAPGAECDGNAMSIIGTIARRLKREVSREAADEWRRDALACRSYDALLRLAMATVDVE